MLWCMLQVQLLSVRSTHRFFIPVTYIFFLQFLEANLFPSAVLPASAIVFFHLSRVTSLDFPFLVLFCLGSHMMTATFIFLILSESHLCKLLLVPVRGFSPATRLPETHQNYLFLIFLAGNSGNQVRSYLFRQSSVMSGSITDNWHMYKSHGDVEMKMTSSVRFSHITLGSVFCFKREKGNLVSF